MQLSLGALLESYASFIAQRWNVATALLPSDRPLRADLLLSTSLDEYWLICIYLRELIPFTNGDCEVGFR